MPSKYVEQIKTIREQCLSEVIYRHLEEKIISNKMLPGERVNENKISHELKVSRTPIREACRQLERDGLVEFKVNQGAFVRDIKIDEVLELYDIRASLEALAAARAALCAQAEDIDELARIIKEMDDDLEQGNMSTYYNATISFHDIILKISRNQSLATIMMVISKKFALFRKKIFFQGQDYVAQLTQKKEIFNAIKKRDEKTAGDLMREHVMGGKKRFTDQIKNKELQMVFAAKIEPQ